MSDFRVLDRVWWSEVLREPGQGWLRWKPDWRQRISYDPPDLDEWMVHPPLRKLALYLRLALLSHPLMALRGDVKWWSEWPWRWSDVWGPTEPERKRLFAK